MQSRAGRIAPITFDGITTIPVVTDHLGRGAS